MFQGINQDNEITISWDLLTVCNLKCPYCYAKKDYKKTFIFNKNNIDTILSLIPKIKNNVIITLLGGEPTLHPLLNYILLNLYSLKNVLKVKLVTNGKRDLKHVLKNDKLEMNFSFHPNQKNFEIIKNLNYFNDLKNKTKVYLLMLKSKLDVVKNFYDLIKDNKNILIYHEYIIKNDKVTFVTPFFDEQKLYSYNDKLLSFRECYDFSFTGQVCELSHFRILADGRIFRECVNSLVGTVFEKGIENKITIQKHICKFKNCHDDCFLEMKKYDNNNIK